MNTKIVVLTVATSLLFTACQSSSTTSGENKNAKTEQPVSKAEKNIAFIVAKNYFANNTLTKLDRPKIETADRFNAAFGMATTMGKDGRPTEIDFNKQYVIAIILPETDLATNIEAVSLQKVENGDIVLSYRVITGQKQSYKIRPNLAVVVDKANNGNVRLNEVK